MERKYVETTVYQEDCISFPETLPRLADWVAEMAALIPEDYANLGRIHLYSDYDSCDTSVKVYYMRLETDEEFAEREDWEVQYRQGQERRERAQLALLKAKYEGHQEP